MTEETKVQETEASAEATNEATVSQEEAMADVAALKRGDTVKGKVVKVEDNQALVDIGYKYDGIIPIRELSSIHLEQASDAVQVGDEVECQILSIDDEKERLLLSKRAVDSVQAWDQLQERFEKGEVFEAQVADVVKGGLVVDLGVRGFIPASMVERHFVEDFSDYKGRTLRLKVKELDRENNKVILSQKDVLDEEFEANKQRILNELQADQVLEGTVQRLTPFGVFVDIGGIDGLVHISELAWTHVAEPSEVVKEGDQVKVKVLKVDPANERISLSMKAVQPGPWEKVNEQFNIGDIVDGVVKRLVSFGAFVEIAPGVEGLVHISQIAHRHIATPHEVLKEGQEVKAKILDINTDEKRVSLSIKETEEAPAQQPRESRKPKQESFNLPENQSLNLTLGERFGDKLSKFK
ncbi:30S ribosomal protein S1 [Xylanibacillus composti]|uniref:30S ribosomal protein S1 n=1 Tax=Xylanibacillus composti TaxID=1572762 RepID=A0A8J4M3P3_9BACL|nr:30S ribosomal protein S1 [Xylanibacillus composti]MDT9725440.1 30S ribosomal protein S1 [Xylanibacillus composti]GIQ71044.1 30S ribosomal protein S1 [Xylanibacillus composti]